MTTIGIEREPLLISTGKVTLPGLIDLPPHATAVVMIANGLGHTKYPAAEPFAARLNEAGFATLMFNLLTPDESQFDSRTAHYSGDPEFESDRLRDVVDWLEENPSTHAMTVIGAGGGAAARGLLHAAGAVPSVFEALVIDGSPRPSDVPAGLSVPALVLALDDAVELRRARKVTEVFAGPTRLQIIPSTDAAQGTDPFFSAAAGRLAGRWLLDVAALAHIDFDKRVKE